MIKSYRIFDYEGTALALPLLNPSDPEQLFKEDRQVKYIEVYQRAENQSVWDETYLKTYYAKDFKS